MMKVKKQLIINIKFSTTFFRMIIKEDKKYLVFNLFVFQTKSF